MLPASKHFTLVVGVDLHLTTLPPFNPLHPYVGMVMDVADYLPMLGSNTYINGVPRGVSDTSGVMTIGKHIPLASGAFACMPMIAHESTNFYGATNTYIEGSRVTPAGYMIMTCADAGVPLNLKPGKKYKPLPSLYAPTSMSIPLPTGAPVLLGGPYIPDFGAMMKNMMMGFGFGAALKGGAKLLKKLGKIVREGGEKLGEKLKNFNHKVLKNPNKPSKFKKALGDALCAMGFEPVNLVIGAVQYAGTDFEFPGILPLRWERSWDSDSHLSGLLGHGVSLCYDMRLERDPEWEVLVATLSDGRPASFIDLPDGESTFNRREKLTLTRQGNTYTLFDHESRLSHHFGALDLNEPHVYRLLRITHESDHAIRLHYQGNRLRSITDAAQRQLDLHTDRQGRITRVEFGHDHQRDTLVSYTYNEWGDMTSITDALGQATTIEYQDHLMVKKTDRNGQSFYWEYQPVSGARRCVHTWGDGGLQEGLIEYHKGYNLVSDGQGQVTRYEFTPEGYITSITDPLGNTRSIHYTDDGDILRVIDPQGNLTGYAYNDLGQLTNIYYPDGGTQLYGYDDEGHLSLMQSPEGRYTTFVYRDHLLRYAYPGGGASVAYAYTTSETFSAVSRPMTATSPCPTTGNST